MDVGAAIVGLILATPLMIGAALAVKLTSPGPVIFRQRRVGQHRTRLHCLQDPVDAGRC
jgi:lipopolysaccharide/colanic/teichoic acid biosynthesis glycosyltransferase